MEFVERGSTMVFGIQGELSVAGYTDIFGTDEHLSDQLPVIAHTLNHLPLSDFRPLQSLGAVRSPRNRQKP